MWLADHMEVYEGLIYSPMSDYEERRREFYVWIDRFPGSGEEEWLKVQKSRLRDPMPHMPDRVVRYDVVKNRKGAKLFIPHNYLPPRCIRMWHRGELTPTEVYAASMYVYGVRTDFIVMDVGTNFPQHEKVQSSVKPQSWAGPGRIVDLRRLKPETMSILHYCLIEEGAFLNVPGIEATTRTKRHHEGKILFVRALHDFVETPNFPAIF